MRARLALLVAAVVAGVLAAFRGCDDDAAEFAHTPPPAPTSALRQGTTATRRAPPRARGAGPGDVAPEPPSASPAAPPSAPDAAKRPARLTVTVKRSDGTPAAGARVVVALSDTTGGGPFGVFGDWERVPDPCPPQTTDAQGRTRFEAEHFWCAWVSASDGDQAGVSDRHTALRPGAEGEATVTLGPSFRIGGVVTDGDGARIPTAVVRMLVPDMGASSLSSVGPYAWALAPLACEGGVFGFPPVLPVTPPSDRSAAFFTPREVVIEAGAEGFLAVRRTVPFESARESVTVALVRTGVLRGRCVDADGREIAGVSVHRAGCDEEHFEPRPWTAATGADGRFELIDFPEVGGSLEFTCEGRAPAALKVPPFDPRAGRDLGDVVLVGGLTARGRVVDTDGLPVAGAWVWFGGLKSRAGSDGRFVVEHLAPGPWSVSAHDEATQRSGSREVADLAEEVTLVARNDRHVRLRIRFAAGSEPSGDPPYVCVRWRRETDPADSRANEQWQHGHYEQWLQPETAGRWIIRVEMDGWGPAEATVEVLAGRAVDAEVTLKRKTK